MGHFFSLILLLLCITACVAKTPTAYQPLPMKEVFHENNNGGYIDRQLSEQEYEIQVRGNQYTDHALLVEYFHRRAAELCGSDHYQATLKEEYHSTIQHPVYAGYYFIPANRYDIEHVTGKVLCKLVDSSEKTEQIR